VRGGIRSRGKEEKQSGVSQTPETAKKEWRLIVGTTAKKKMPAIAGATAKKGFRLGRNALMGLGRNRQRLFGETEGGGREEGG